ncbi:nuclease-related domain-containing protein [Bacillus gaemokensis]|uniref:Nuclease n=1 Tax=Bacillus gaemokensis TaxID=574375 RepID=A0A073KFU3_9BACI|nr:nuclease-related domain-containing protein [Bacillus gaemokensis]KEK25322.1 nuclease [Bacillus gaemokensis]KYG37233.1 nuclease [Bacillus gaemokensis]
MIVKEREIPVYLRQLEALLRRLPANHLKRDIISEKFAKHKAGYKGEQAIDYPLSFLSNKEYNILHDIRLFEQDHYFQIDTLIISSRFLLFLEIKNITGTLLFDTEFNQLIRISEQKSEGFPDPMLQIKRQEMQLQKWLDSHGFSNLPIEFFVVISTPRTIIKTSFHNQDLPKKITHSANLPNKIKQLESVYVKKRLSAKKLQKLMQHIMIDHSPLQKNPLEQYSITKDELLKGVQCPECLFISMNKVKRGWHCTKCNALSKEAHKYALQDYALLLGTTITNKELKAFLNIASSSVVKRLIHTMALPYQGENKGRKYDLTILKFI